MLTATHLGWDESAYLQVRKRLLHRVCKAVDSVRKQEGPLAGNRGGKRGFELQRQVCPLVTLPARQSVHLCLLLVSAASP